jgi:hypothetical protein
VRQYEFLPGQRIPLQIFAVRIRVPGTARIMDATVQARNAEQARRVIKAQFGDQSRMIGQPRQLRTK